MRRDIRAGTAPARPAPSTTLPTVSDTKRADEPIEGEVPVEPASMGRRFGALVIDWVLCVAVARVFGDPIRGGYLGLVPLGVLVVEYAFFLGLFAQTPGMYVTSVRCVSYPGGGRIGVLRAALRGLLLCLVIPAIVMDLDRRGWHDKAARSIVVAAPRR